MLAFSQSNCKYQKTSDSCLSSLSGFFIEAEPGLSASSKTEGLYGPYQNIYLPEASDMCIDNRQPWCSLMTQSTTPLPQIPASIFTAQQVVAASSLRCSLQSSRSEPSLPGKKTKATLSNTKTRQVILCQKENTPATRMWWEINILFGNERTYRDDKKSW